MSIPIQTIEVTPASSGDAGQLQRVHRESDNSLLGIFEASWGAGQYTATAAPGRLRSGDPPAFLEDGHVVVFYDLSQLPADIDVISVSARVFLEFVNREREDDTAYLAAFVYPGEELWMPLEDNAVANGASFGDNEGYDTILPTEPALDEFIAFFGAFEDYNATFPETDVDIVLDREAIDIEACRVGIVYTIVTAYPDLMQDPLRDKLTPNQAFQFSNPRLVFTYQEQAPEETTPEEPGLADNQPWKTSSSVQIGERLGAQDRPARVEIQADLKRRGKARRL